jgi:hypothetical protein
MLRAAPGGPARTLGENKAEAMMTRFAMVLAAALAAAVLGGGAAQAQAPSISPGLPLGVTSPLGIGPSAPVGPTRIPLGATELATPGASPILSGASPLDPLTGVACGGALSAAATSATTGASGRDVDTRITCRPGWHPHGRDRDGQCRPQPAFRCADPESLGAGHEHAEPAGAAVLRSLGIVIPVDAVDLAQPAAMHDDADGCPDDLRRADNVRIAVDRPYPKYAGDELPLSKSCMGVIRAPGEAALPFASTSWHGASRADALDGDEVVERVDLSIERVEIVFADGAVLAQGRGLANLHRLIEILAVGAANLLGFGGADAALPQRRPARLRRRQLGRLAAIRRIGGARRNDQHSDGEAEDAQDVG